MPPFWYCQKCYYGQSTSFSHAHIIINASKTHIQWVILGLSCCDGDIRFIAASHDDDEGATSCIRQFAYQVLFELRQ